MPRKSATEVKIDFLVKEIRELRNETASLRADIKQGKRCYMDFISFSRDSNKRI
jgi:hypothetical protein